VLRRLTGGDGDVHCIAVKSGVLVTREKEGSGAAIGDEEERVLVVAPPEAVFNERFEGSVADGADAFDGVFFLSEHCEPKHVAVTVPAHGGRGAQVCMRSLPPHHTLFVHLAQPPFYNHIAHSLAC
jgi:hypothetical protein